MWPVNKEKRPPQSARGALGFTPVMPVFPSVESEWLAV